MVELAWALGGEDMGVAAVRRHDLRDALRLDGLQPLERRARACPWARCDGRHLHRAALAACAADRRAPRARSRDPEPDARRRRDRARRRPRDRGCRPTARRSRSGSATAEPASRRCPRRRSSGVTGRPSAPEVARRSLPRSHSRATARIRGLGSTRGGRWGVPELHACTSITGAVAGFDDGAGLTAPLTIPTARCSAASVSRTSSSSRRPSSTFAPGLNAITGETGAGKTILAQAIGLLLGAKGDAGLIGPDGRRPTSRPSSICPTGCSRRTSSPRWPSCGPSEEDGLVVARRVFADGRTRAYAWGRAPRARTSLPPASG